MRRVRFIPLLLLVVIAEQATAQWRVSGDLGFARLEQTGIPQSNAQTFGATIDGAMQRGWVRSSLLASRTTTERWTAQGVALAGLSGRAMRNTQWELSSAASMFAETNANTASSAEVLGRMLLGSSRRGTALGFGGGIRRADAGWQPMGYATAGGWIAIGREQLALDVVGITTSTTPVASSDRFGFSYADASVSWRHDQGIFSIGATAGARTSNTSLVPNTGWASVDAALRVTSWMTLVAAGGQSPQNVVRGVPRITFASLTLRLSSPLRPARPVARPRGSGPHLSMTRELIELHVVAAERVELTADFTDWAPVALERVGDVWRLERAVTPGLHRLMIRIDGGEWITPANLPKAKDDLGGVVALVTVP